MSYTRSFEGSVTASGSRTVSYHYPASQNGGSGSVTVNFHETVPIRINIHVDTDPFDQSIAYANSHVDGLTGAIVAMNGAQCVSIQESGEKISNSITQGFYRLIGSEITTQISENKSLLQSKIALVMELSKDIAKKHARMSEDINRLKRHYSQVFQAIDEDCEKRVLALDRSAFILSKVRDDLIKHPYLRSGSFSLQETKDINNNQILSVIARLRSKVSGIINVMTHTTLNTQKYLRDIHNLSVNIPTTEKVVSYVPVVYFEKQDIDGDGHKSIDSITNSFVPSKEQVKNKVTEFVSGVQAERWTSVSESEKQMVNQWFMNIAEQDLASSQSEDKQRVYDQIVALWKAREVKTL